MEITGRLLPMVREWLTEFVAVAEARGRRKFLAPNGDRETRSNWKIWCWVIGYGKWL